MILFLRYLILNLFVLMHPFYLSVTDIKYNDKNKSIEISCKMFVNDLEDALKRTSGKKIDLIHPGNKVEMEKILSEYIEKRFKVNCNQIDRKFNFMGFEKEDDVIWAYLEIKNVEKPKSIKVENKLLFDYLKEQINLVHLEIGTFKESSKVTNPEHKMTFSIP